MWADFLKSKVVLFSECGPTMLLIIVISMDRDFDGPFASGSSGQSNV